MPEASTNNSDSSPTSRATIPFALDLGALSVTLVWGTGVVVQKVLLATFSPAGYLCLRNLMAGTILIAIMWLLRRSLWSALSVSFWPLLGAGLLMGAQMLSFVCALKLTHASEAALLISTAPVWTTAIVATFGRETIYPRNWAGILVALGGVAMVVLGAGHATGGQAPARIAGDMLMIISAFLYGLYMVFSRSLMQRHGALTVTTISTVLSNVVIVPLGLRDAITTPWATLTVLQWGLLAYTILVGTVYGMTMWYRSIKTRGASRTAAYQYLVPIVALGAAVLFLHEQPTRWQLAGIVITLCGVYLAHHRPSEYHPG